MNRFVLWSFISDSWQYNPWITDNKIHPLTTVSEKQAFLGFIVCYIHVNRAPVKLLRLTMEE